MTDFIPENREEKYSERFDRDAQSGGSAEEDRIVGDYRFLRETLRGFPVWPTDRNALSQRMADEFRKTRIRWLPLAACIAFVLFTGVYAESILKTPAVSAVGKVAFRQSVSNRPVSVPWLWAKRIAQGRRVTVPPGIEAQFDLRDGSTINAKSGAQLAIDYTQQRDIRLHYGFIAIDAAHIPDSTMTVFTPCNRVEVVGTKFWINVK